MATQQVPTEEDIIAGAIAGTEQEIFDEATGQAEDENNGDRSLEEMDDVPGETEEGDEGPEAEEPDGEGEEDEGEELAASEEEGEEPEPDPAERGGRIPSSRLREEAERRRIAEQQVANTQHELAALRAQLQQQIRQPQQEQPAKPDLFSDPDAVLAQRDAQLEQRFADRYVNASLFRAHRERGEEFEAAYKALTSLNPADPANRATVQSIYSSPEPGLAVMDWYDQRPERIIARQREQFLNDPEFRKEALQYWRGEAERGDGGRPRTTTRLPRSLNGASGGGSRREADPELYNDSDNSVFAYAMK